MTGGRSSSFLSAVCIILLGLALTPARFAAAAEGSLLIREAVRVFDGPGFESNGRFSPDGRRVAFQSNASGRWDVYVGDLSTGESVAITPSTHDDGRPAWSPDGRHLAFHSDRSGSWDIWVMDADGRNPRRLTEASEDDIAPHWSSRNEIVYQSQSSGSWDLWVVPAHGGEPRRLTSHAGNEWHPRWSPDGRSVIFYSTWVAWTDLWIVSANDGSLSELLISEWEDYFPNWSPGSEAVIFSSDRGKNEDGAGGEVWSVATSGGEPRRLTDLLGETRFAELSPDASQMLLTERRSVSNLRVVDTRTGASRSLTDGQADDSRPAFTADGRHVVFQSDREASEWHLYRVASRGGRVEQLTHGRLNHDAIRPAADGARYAFTAGGGDYISFDLFTMPSAGGAPTQLTQLGNVRFPVWCGERLVFSHSPTSYTDSMRLYIIGPSEVEPRPVYHGVVVDSPTDCSPDGSEVMFAIQAADGRDLHAVAVDGGELRRITDRDGFDGSGSWSPDGRRIAFVSDRDGDRELYVMPSGGESAERLTDLEGEALDPRWSPDGHSIVYQRRILATGLRLLNVEGRFEGPSIH